MTRPLDDREALIAALAEEARSGAREEPEPEELLDYLAGRLSPEDEQRLDRHLLTSPDTARALLDLADFEAAEAEAGARPPDVAVHAGWRDLERRLPAARPWPHRLPAVLLPGIAAALLVTTVGFGSRVWKLEGELRRPIPNVASHELSSASRAGREQAFPVQAGEPLLLVLDPRASCAGYEAQVEGPGPGNPRTVSLKEDEEGYLTLMLQRPEPGPYRLRLSGCEPRRELGEHRFRITHDDG
jgi:hypothetical protein